MTQLVWLRSCGFLLQKELRNLPPVQTYMLYVTEPLEDLVKIGKDAFYAAVFPEPLGEYAPVQQAPC
jgi:hypothetical protein